MWQCPRYSSTAISTAAATTGTTVADCIDAIVLLHPCYHYSRYNYSLLLQAILLSLLQQQLRLPLITVVLLHVIAILYVYRCITITEVGAEAKGASASEFLNPQGGALGEYWVHNGRFVSEERLQVSNGRAVTVICQTILQACHVIILC
jgi:hypothetical protein